MIYKCERCGFISSLKRSVVRHLQNKEICLPIYSSVDREECLKYLDIREQNLKACEKENIEMLKKNIKRTQKTTEKKIPFSQDEMSNLGARTNFLTNFEEGPIFENKLDICKSICEFCNKSFNKKTSYYRHRKHNCREKKIAENKTNVLNDRLNLVIKEMDKLKSQVENSKCIKTNNGNIVYGNNININIKKFCYEDRSYITEDIINHLGNTQLYNIAAKIAKLIHINPDHSENCNVKISSMRSKVATIYNGEKWIKDDKKKILGRILRDCMDLFDDKYTGGREQAVKFTRKYFNDDKEIIKTLVGNLELMFINNLDLIEEICRERDGGGVLEL